MQFLFLSCYALACLALINAAPVSESEEKRGGLVSAIGGLTGSQDAGGALAHVAGLLGGRKTGSSHSGSSHSGSTSGSHSSGSSVGDWLTPDVIDAISGLTDGAVDLANSVLEHGAADPQNGADAHHHAAEHGAQNAILKALQDGSFGK
ncbi:uncharacterized protein [Watersipora subatra]|uniref:uncharacterized protein n=1 Tax=Watersipora subatra TaxID=2589382 RepID=UPI00355BC9C3